MCKQYEKKMANHKHKTQVERVDKGNQRHISKWLMNYIFTIWAIWDSVDVLSAHWPVDKYRACR